MLIKHLRKGVDRGVDDSGLTMTCQLFKVGDRYIIPFSIFFNFILKFSLKNMFENYAILEFYK